MIPQAIGRAQLQDTPAGLRIVIPAKWRWVTFIGELALVGVIFAAPRAWLLLDTRATAAIIVFFLLVTVVRRWLWNVCGKEIVTLSEKKLMVRYEIFSVGWHWSYNLDGVSNFRFAPPVDRYWIHEHRTVAFDYEFMPRRFGLYLTAPEAAQLIAVIQGYMGSQRPALTHA
jgi:hypothetical protein